jgi:tRNA dimethylallyltransferase
VKKPAFLAITGPTASGKTDLSVGVAEHLPSEIISMDSRQVYRGMDIGTDKVGDGPRARVPHHGLDLVEPDQRYSAGQFARDARTWITEITGRGRLPLLVGGTGFFLKAVMEPIFTQPPMERERVENLRRYLNEQPRDLLERWVRRLDPERARLAVEGGPQRMGRTLEVALLTGRPMSWWHREAPPEGEGLHGMVVCLSLPKEEMDRRIDERVSTMVERGLVEEVQALLDAGCAVDAPGMTGTGYRETARYLAGEISVEDAVEEIRRNTRRYARRQLTWYRNQLPDGAVVVDALEPLETQVARVLETWTVFGRTGTPYAERKS